MAQFVSGSVLTASSLNSQFNTQTIATATANYTLGSVNAGELVLLNSAGAGTVTIPLDATYNFATGTIIEMYNSGAGSWSIATAGTASTVSGSSTTLSQYQASRLIKTAPSTWFVDGGAGAANAVLKTGTSSTSGTMDFSGSVVKGAGLDLITPTSIANSGGSASASGGAVTLSAVNSVSLNGCFSSTYDNYRIVFRGNQSAASNLEALLRLSGTDASGANYSRQYVVADNATVSAGRTTGNTNYVLAASAATVGGWCCDIYAPAIAANTAFMTVVARGDSVTQFESGIHSVATAYDGITLIGGGASTITGTVRIYGYRN